MSPVSEPIAGLILAAGASTRMGRPKALLPYRGESFLDRLIRLFSPCCSPVVVVVGYHADAVRAQARSLSAATVVTNPTPEAGQLSSLQCGLRSLDPECAGAVFCPVDLPAIAPETVLRVAGELSAAAHSGAGTLLVIPRSGGRRGHPVGVRRELFSEFLALAPTAQAREAIHRHAGATVYVEVDDPGILRDIDSPADYQSLLETEPGQ